MRLDAEKLDTLRRWGDGLSKDERDEVRSAGRAILLLIEEIERLHIDLWHARPEDQRGPAPEPELAPKPELEPERQEEAPAHELATPLRARLARLFR